MIHLLPFLLGLSIGSLVYRLLTQRWPWGNLIDIGASYLIGMAVCSYLVFIQIVAGGHYNADMVKVLTVILVAILFLLNRFIKTNETCNSGSYYQHWPMILAMVIGVFTLAWKLASINPYGGWDAWSYWNYRAYFVALSGDNWKDIFTYGIHSKHPWLVHDWMLFNWSWAGHISTVAPSINTVILTTILPILVLCGLCEWGVPFYISFLAAAWMISIPYSFIHGISQYADPLMACFITIVIIYLRRVLIKTSDQGMTMIFGALMGSMLLTKDEGLFVLLTLCLLIRLYFPKKSFQWKKFIIPICVLLPFYILVKIWMIPGPIGQDRVDLNHLIQFSRMEGIFKFYISMLSSYVYGGLYIVPIVLGFFYILGNRIKTVATRLTFNFLTAYMVFFFSLYVLLEKNLLWRLETSAYRVEYMIMPLTIMFIFDLIFADKD